ncbi:uncharacterized protein LOC111995069 [Quercus suber]|uniref:uncharacterized protein LOC111995069 n=1 Tax=Quercus suber TaxID=58331 RepID=UPI000CE1EAD4|nr:uncharacterized protein LOC111995069 [Quercus suber]
MEQKCEKQESNHALKEARSSEATELQNRSNGPRIYNLQKEIADLHQGEVFITDFFTQLKVLWDQLQSYGPFPSCTCGKCVCNVNTRLSDLQVRESVLKFLMGLNDSFSQVRSQVLPIDPLPYVSKVYALLIQEEMQRSVTNQSGVKVDSTALVVKMQNFNAGITSGGNGVKGKDKPVCTHCGKTGHIADKCYRLHGFPPVFKFKNKPSMAHQVSAMSCPNPNDSVFTPEQCQQLLALINPCSPLASAVQGKDIHGKDASLTCVPSSSSSAMAGIDASHSVFSAKVVNRRAYTSDILVIDTGATDHIVCSVNLLSFITAIAQSIVELPNGEATSVTHIGTVNLSFSLTLHNDLTCWRTIGMGKANDGLYLLQSGSTHQHSSSSLDDFLGDYVLAAAYLINRLPSPLLNNKTPFELLFHKPPSYDHLRVFGCDCFASTNANTRSKFDPMSRRCVFIGYPFNVKGYKVFDLHTHIVFISRDAVFHESIFPFLTFVSHSNTDLPVPLPCTSPLPFDDLSSFSSSHLISQSASSMDDTIFQLHHELDDEFLHDVPIEPPEPLTDPIPLRKSSRVTKRPSYLQAYHFNMVTSIPTADVLHTGTSHPLTSHLSYKSLSPSFKAFCCSISSIVEPSHYYQAVSDPKWQDAMAAEIAALEANNTWTLTIP